VTYPDNQVAEMLNTHFIPVQVDIEKASALADRFQALWTPNLNVVDGNGRCVHQVLGWLPPGEFCAMLQIGRGYHALFGKRFAEAAPLFGEVGDRFPDSIYAPEAMYFHGVGRYLASHAVDDLKAGWTELQSRYPQSAWALKSDVL
jgi:hypothetical protein